MRQINITAECCNACVMISELLRFILTENKFKTSVCYIFHFLGV